MVNKLRGHLVDHILNQGSVRNRLVFIYTENTSILQDGYRSIYVYTDGCNYSRAVFSFADIVELTDDAHQI